MLNTFCMTSLPIGNDSDQPGSTKKFVNQLDLIQTLQQTKTCVEGNRKKNCRQILSGVISKQKKIWPFVRPLNVPEPLSLGQSCLLAGKDTLYHTMSLLSEFSPLVASLQAQKLRQLPWGWGILLVSQHCSIVLLTTTEMNTLSSPYS